MLQCRVLAHNAHRKNKAQFTHAILEQQAQSTSPARVGPPLFTAASDVAGEASQGEKVAGESTAALSLPAQFAIQVCRTDIFIGFRCTVEGERGEARELWGDCILFF